MAANDFYAPYNPQRPAQSASPTPLVVGDDGPLPPPAWSKPTPARSPSPYNSYGTPYDRDNSQYTHGSDLDYPPSAGAGGRLHGTDQYADDIPLKQAQQQPGGRPEWIDADTHYPPSPESQRVPLNPDGPAHGGGGWGGGKKFLKKKIPWFTYLMTTIQVAVFIAEIVRNAQLTGSPIMIHPQFNPMIGPSPYVQINMGARYVPCMRNEEGVQDSKNEFNGIVPFPCPNTKSSDPEDKNNQCQLSDLCGFTASTRVPDPKPNGSLEQKPEPNQWFRFIIPMFLHAGLIHIGFNMMAQLTIGADMEKEIGWWRYGIVYFASGIFGFILGANFAAPGIASTGASGCLFGVLALACLDLFYTWRSRSRPVVELIVMIITIGISFVLGLLPGLDNFSHIGGFLVGLVLGISLLRSPDPLRERIGTTPYEPMSGGIGATDESKRFAVKEPTRFFKGRKPLWWVWWIVRAGTLVGIIIAFVLLLNNFYKYRSKCSWCKHLTCLPVKNWCDVGKIAGT
ncbi:hypothetical protein FQN53_002441 [Emmonsiellopsis sp. PD_33]|nr:hypothetical protein FQN53_002441 [Emmonsiellopsis sp. PD_33]KAK2787617.1 hypothetical protein FQN51_003112 [Onygenales sp. PD_10]